MSVTPPYREGARKALIRFHIITTTRRYPDITLTRSGNKLIDAPRKMKLIKTPMLKTYIQNKAINFSHSKTIFWKDVTQNNVELISITSPSEIKSPQQPTPPPIRCSSKNLPIVTIAPLFSELQYTKDLVEITLSKIQNLLQNLQNLNQRLPFLEDTLIHLQNNAISYKESFKILFNSHIITHNL
jgi:hypothetical protein